MTHASTPADITQPAAGRAPAASPAREPDAGAAAARARSRLRRHWRRWVVLVATVLVAATWLGARAIVDGWSQPPLRLPGAAAAPVGPIDGIWQVSSGSMAGFRIEQTVLGMHGDIVGRTDRVTGAATVAGGRVTTAAFEVDLRSITASGRAVTRLQDALDTAAHPTATFTLDVPVDVGADLAAGAARTFTVSGQLSLRGVAHAVSATIEVRRDGATVDVVGLIPVDLADWGVGPFEDAGPLGSISDRGSAEFLLVLTRL